MLCNATQICAPRKHHRSMRARTSRCASAQSWLAVRATATTTRSPATAEQRPPTETTRCRGCCCSRRWPARREPVPHGGYASPAVHRTSDARSHVGELAEWLSNGRRRRKSATWSATLLCLKLTCRTLISGCFTKSNKASQVTRSASSSKRLTTCAWRPRTHCSWRRAAAALLEEQQPPNGCRLRKKITHLLARIVFGATSVSSERESTASTSSSRRSTLIP
jgi:hypothetical protein